MNTSAFKYLFMAALLWACNREPDDLYVIDPQHVSNGSGLKTNLKSDLQLITIMYSDVFGKSIENEELQAILQAYAAFGDKNIVIDRVTQHFLLQPDAQIPTASAMRAQPEAFISEAYERFFVRLPNEAEVFFLKREIEKNTQLQPRDVYYAMLTAEEYKYY